MRKFKQLLNEESRGLMFTAPKDAVDKIRKAYLEWEKNYLSKDSKDDKEDQAEYCQEAKAGAVWDIFKAMDAGSERPSPELRKVIDNFEA